MQSRRASEFAKVTGGAELVEAGSGSSGVKRLRPNVGELAALFSSRCERVHSSEFREK